MNVKVKLLRGQTMPMRSHPDDACYDLHWHPPGKQGPRMIATLRPVTLGTGLALELPAGYEAVVRPRSGLAAKQGVLGLVGTIDAGYRGEIMVTLINCGDDIVTIIPGDRIAQLAIRPIPDVVLEQVDKLAWSCRGDKGHGSTGR